MICLYNTLTRKKEELKLHEPGKVKMYTCGLCAYRKFTDLYYGGRSGTVFAL